MVAWSCGALKRIFSGVCSTNLLARYGFHSNLPKCDGGLGMLSPWNWLRMAVDLARTPHFDAWQAIAVLDRRLLRT